MQGKMDSEADLFAALRNDFNFAYISEFMHHFSSAFFTEREDEKPTSPVLRLEASLGVFNSLLPVVLGTLASIPRRSKKDWKFLFKVNQSTSRLEDSKVSCMGRSVPVFDFFFLVMILGLKA